MKRPHIHPPFPERATHIYTTAVHGSAYPRCWPCAHRQVRLPRLGEPPGPLLSPAQARKMARLFLRFKAMSAGTFRCQDCETEYFVLESHTAPDSEAKCVDCGTPF